MPQLVLSGFALGLFLAAQVGPVTLLIVRSVVRGGRALAVGFAMAGAVAIIDVLYAVLGLVGLGRLLNGDVIRVAFGLASAGVLVVVGVRSLWAGMRARGGLECPEETILPRRAFATAVAATAFNPLTIALWTISFPAAAPGAASVSDARAVALLAGVGLGTLTWYAGFSTLVALARNRFGNRLVRTVDTLSGAGLIGFGGLLGYRTLHDR